MARNTEPKLTASDEMDSEQHKALRLFTKATRSIPNTMAHTIHTFGEVDTTATPRTTTPAHKLAQRAVRQILKTGADLEAKPDPETAESMRRAIVNIDPLQNPEARRLARLGVFTIEVGVWEEQQAAKFLVSQETQQADSSAA